MDFDVKLRKHDGISFLFTDDDFEPFDRTFDEPVIISGEIFVDDKCIGIIDGYCLYNDEAFYSKCENLSGDSEVIASVICGDDGCVLDKYLNDVGDCDEIFILDKIQIDEKYRNKGIGGAILKNLSKMLRYQFDCGSNIFLCASSFEKAQDFGFDSKEYTKSSKDLVNFYKKFGFKEIAKNVMYFNDKA